MNRKKTIIIFALAFVLLTIICVLLVLNKNKGAVPSTTNTSSTPGQFNTGSGQSNPSSNVATTVPGFSTDSSARDKFVAMPDNINEPYAKGSLPDNASYSYINNVYNKEEIKNAFEKFVSKANAPTAKSREWTQFFNPNKTIIPINKTYGALGLNIKKELGDIIDSYDYEFFYCSTEGRKDFGLQLTIKQASNYPGDTMDGAAKFMKEWENNILSDIHTILFPGEKFTSEQLQQKLNFKDGSYRYTEVVLPNREKKFIDYGFVANYIAITTSLECMNKVSNDLEGS